MLNYAGDDIIMPENLINQSQKVGVERRAEKDFSPDPVPAGNVLRPNVVIERIHGRGKEMGVGFDLQQVDRPQKKSQDEYSRHPDYVFTLL